MKTCLVVAATLSLNSSLVFADPLEDCRTNQLVVQETQMLRSTLYMGEAEATEEMIKRLKAGDYIKYGVEYDPDDHPSVIAMVFLDYDPNLHHLEAADRFYAGCVDGVMNEGDEGDGS